MGRILIIDDETDLLYSLQKILQKKGYEVVVLSRPEAAMNMIHVLKPDVLLLDIMMDQMDGRDICMQLKANNQTKRIHVILFSGYINKTEEYIAYGADDFIEKPVHLPTLLKKIESKCAEVSKARHTI